MIDTISIYRDCSDSVAIYLPCSDLMRSLINFCLKNEDCALTGAFGVSCFILRCTSLKSAHRIAELISSISGVPCVWHKIFGSLYTNPMSKRANHVRTPS